MTRAVADFQELTLVEQAIRVIASLDPNSFAFRYPVNKKGEPTIHMPCIDVVTLRDAVTHLFDIMTVAIDRFRQLEAHGAA
ncbi:MAG: hypothetical protein M3N52_01340 [Actinomycetota bacterium]|nr:hypothetical protein [Actinomycetota bacterium]